MRQALAPAQPRWPSSGTRAAAPLSTLVYRSRAVKTLSPPELHDLTEVSQARNQRLSVTGLMVYDNDRFFQWLEGPPDSVERVMHSIKSDARHTEIEVLDSRPAQARAFGDWSMKLATPNPVMTSWRSDVIEPPREVVDGLRARPEAAPALLVKLGPWPTGRQPESDADDLANLPICDKTASILKTVFLTAVMPHLVAANGGPARAASHSAHPRAMELADLLVATDPDAAAELIVELREGGSTVGRMSAALFEPAARRLGDLWDEDLCTEFDVTVALCRLQAAARLLESGTAPRHPSRQAPPLVLIAPEPGELHRLGAALDGSVLRNAGWSPHCEYPSDDQALNDLLSSTWFDVLDLSLSTAFRRDHTLPRVARTIADARHASRNPALVVVIGGRVFVEDSEAGAAVGADHAATTARDMNRSILETMTGSQSVTLAASTACEVSVS